MYFCFVCSAGLDDYKALFSHLKCCHQLGPKSIYHCKQHNCTRTFSHIRSFRRHIITSHVTTPNIPSEVSPQNCDDMNSIQLSCSSLNISDNINNVHITAIENCSNIKDSFQNCRYVWLSHFHCIVILQWRGFINGRINC